MQQRTHDKLAVTDSRFSFIGLLTYVCEGALVHQRLDFWQPLSQTSLCLAFRSLRSKGLCRCQPSTTAATSNKKHQLMEPDSQHSEGGARKPDGILTKAARQLRFWAWTLP